MATLRRLLFLILVGFVLLLQDSPLPADTNDVFVQTDWLGGSSSSNAVHPTNKTGWTYFSSKDTYINTGIAGRVTGSPELLSVTDTSDTDFSAGTRSSTMDISGSGAAASLVLQGTNDDAFVDNLGQWTSLPEVPALTYWSPYVRAGNYIYALFRYKTFGRFDIATEKWEILTDFPVVTGYGASLAYPGSGDFIYATRGGNTKDFYKYSISGGTWTKLADVTYQVGHGASMASNGTMIYCLVGGGTNKFYSYSIAGNTWTTLPTATTTVTRGGSLVYPGSGTDLFAIFQNGSTTFSRFSIAGNAWVPLTAAPQAVANLSYPGTGNYLYAWYEADTYWNRVARYNFVTPGWEDLTPPAKTANSSTPPIYPYRGTFYYPGSGTKVKWLSMGNLARPMTFDTATLTWDELIGPKYLNSIGYGSRSLWDGGDYIYFLRSDGAAEFARYTISTNAWINRAAPPWGTYRGADMVYLNGKVYLQQGYGATGFASYDPATNLWTPLTGTPAAVDTGGSMATDGTDIYSFRGAATATFWKYTVVSNTWAAATDAPATVDYGGSLLRPATDDSIYATCGNNTRSFYKYSLSGNSWTQLTDAPYYFTNKVILTYPGSGDYIYAFNGQDQTFARYKFRNSGAGVWETLPATPFLQDMYHVASAAGDKIYATRAEWDMNVYTISSGTWNTTRNYDIPILAGYGSVVYTGGDTVYFIYGDNTTLFWKYSVSQKRWTGLVKVPFMLCKGTKSVYPGSGNYIYVMEGHITNHLWRYDFVNDTWTQMANAPLNFFGGSQLEGIGDVLYAIQGRDPAAAVNDQRGNGFAQYTISTNTWATLATLPAWITNGSERGNYLVHVPSQGKLFWKRPNGGTEFYEYNIGSGVWTARTATVAGYNGQALYYPGSGDYIYNVQNNSTPPTFYRYSISGNAWTRLSNPSRGGGYTGIDGDMFYPGSGDYLYYFDATVEYFSRYSLSRDDWDQPLTFPSTYCRQYYSAFGTGLDGDTFYSGGYRYFWKYTISTRIWTALRSPYDDIGWEWNGQWSPEITNPGSGNFLYATRGRNYADFARYSVSQNLWSALKSPTVDGLYNFGDGHRLAATTSKVYCLRGASTRNFWGYNITTNTWSSLADLPAGMTVNYGSSLCYPGSGDFIYATRGDGSSDFFKYSISGNAWTQLAGLPIILLASDTNGASLTYPGRGDYLYLIPASNYIQSAPVAYFYRYSLSQNTWEEIASAPAGFGGNAKIIYPGRGDYLYAMRGGAGVYYDILKYRLFKQGLYTSPTKNIGRNQSYDVVTWTDNSKGTLEFKVRTSTSATLSDAPDWSSIAKIAKGGNISDSYPIVKPNDLYLQYQMGFFTDDLTKLPSLDSISINYYKYRHQQELISSAYNSMQVHNRLMKLSWTNTVPEGTDVRFQLRTAPDDNGQPGTWSPWLGPTGTQTLNDTYTLDTDYVFAPTVEVINGVGRLKKMLENYSYTQRIFLDNSASSTSYTDIVQAIDITSANNHFWEHVKSDGSDVRFVDGDGNTLSYNLASSGASFNYASKTAKIYVKLLSLPAGQKTTIFLKYGKSDAVSASDPTVMGLPASNNLVAYYRFDEGSGNVAADSSGHGNNGTLMNSPTWGAGKRNTALSFNGTNQYINLGSDASLKLNLPLTFGMWVNLPTGIDGNWRHLISCAAWYGNPGYDTMLYQNQYLIMSVNSSEPTTPRPAFGIPTGDWHHITYTVSPTTSKVYVDGILRQTWIGSWSLTASSYNTWIGYSPAGSYNYFWGSMDEVVIYNRDLTDTEVTQLYQGSGASVAPYYFSSVEDNTTSPSLSGWEYRNTVEIDNTLGGDLTNYQIKVVVTPGQETFWARCKADGSDVRFVDSDNSTILNHYAASFDYANKVATFWVKIPTITAGQSKNIYLYYGRADAVTTSNINGTLVKDFGETGPSNSAGLSVDGLGIKATVPSSPALSPTQAVTVEANVKYGIEYWPAGWSYRKKITLDNSAGLEKANGGVQFDVPFVSGKMKADYSDLRFWETDHSQKLRYRIVSYDAAKATVYVMLPYLPAASTKDIYVYYGNAAATSESDSNLIPYIFYDDFNGSLSQWGASSGASQTTVDGRTAALVTTGYLQTTSLLPFLAGHTYTFEYSARASGAVSFVGLGSVSAKNATGMGVAGYVLGMDQLFNNNGYIYNQIGNGTSTWSINRITYATSAWYTNKMTWTPGTSVNYDLNSSQYNETQTSYVPVNSDAIYPTIRASTGFIYVDYIKIYEGQGYDITSITPTFGAEQPDPQVANPTFVRWLPGFGYRKKINIDNTGGSAMTNFVITFDVAFVSGKMQANYGDIRFVDSDGKKLSYNINSYDGSKATVSVKIPILPANSTKPLYLYYGNATTESEQDSTVLALPTSGLIAWWKCDEGTGTVLVDSSGNSRTGTLQGTTTWTTGKFGNALSLNNGWVSVPAMTPGTGKGSLSAWIQITSSTNQPLINGVAGFWMSEFNVAGRLGFDVSRNSAWADGNGGQTTGLYVDAVPFSTWVHIVMTVEDGLVKIYKNGVLVKTKSYAGGNLTDQTVSGTGGLGRWGTTYGTGILDDVAVYNRTLSASEVAGIYAGTGVTPTFATEETAPATIDQAIALKSGSYGLKFTNSGLTAVLNGTTLSTTHYYPGQFMHAAMTYDGTSLKLFVNGVQKATTPLTGVITTNGNSLTIGDGMNGVVDEPRVWSIARLSGNIDEDQLKYLSGASTGLVSYLRFNEGSGTTAVDASIYTNNATLSSASWVADPFQYSNAMASAIYHMDEGSGVNTADSSGNNNTLTLSNTTWVSTDLTGFTGGKSLNFNGATSYANASANASLDVTGKISLEAWIKPLTTSGNHTILAKGTDSSSRWNYQLVQIADSVAFQFFNGATKQHVVTPGFLVVNNVYYIAATFDESTDTVKIYSNGTLLYTNTVEPSVMKVNTDPLYIGREASGATPFSGSIDEVRIYKRVLTANEILTHYEQRLLAMNPPTVYHKTEPTVSAEIGAYVTDNPVIQPVMGVFYTSSNLIQFQEISNKPFGTEIKYQISFNGYMWYWWDGTQWTQVTGGYSQTNTASEVNSHLAAFQALSTDGDFYYRAYLHSEPYSFKTPSLDNIGTSLLTNESYYVSADGSTEINPLHTDADNDQWFQYKAILYSEGEDTPFLDDVSLEYINSFVQVLSPNGNEVFAVGSTIPITWTSQSLQKTGGSGLVKIEYSIDGGSTYQTIATNVTNTGSYNWTIPDTPSQQALIKISSEDLPVVSDTSNTAFRILALEVTSPNGGEAWEFSKAHNITWNVTGAIPNNVVKIEYSADGATNWQTISAVAPNTGTFEWIMPAVYSDNVKVQISSPSNSQIMDISDAAFSILPLPAFTISSPAGGDQWSVGATVSIAWRTNSLLFSSNVILEYSTDDFQSDIHTIATVSIGTPQGPNKNDDIVGSYSWTVPDFISPSVKVRVREDAIPPGRDTQQEMSATSQAFSIIEPKINITSPATNDVWVVGDNHNITWTTQGHASDDLKLEYSTNGTSYTLIQDHLTNSGSFPWTVPAGAVGNSVFIRITDNQRTQVTGVSSALRVLAHATIEVILPNGGETLAMGTDYNVQWRSYGQKLESGGADYNKISIYYSTDNGANWTLAAFDRSNTGSYTWRVPDFPTTQALIKVADQNDPLAVDVSDAVFSIVLPTITLTSPNGGETWYATGNYNITWTSVGSVGNVKLEYSSNGGSSWTLIATGRPNTGNYLWSPIADVNSSQVRVRVTDVTYPTVTSTSAANFTITPPSITLTVPNGGESWAVGTTQNVRWYSVGKDYGAVRDNLTIQYSTNGGTSWTTVATSQADDGLYEWIVPDTIATTCRVKIFDADRPATADTSDANFSITLPSVTITAPNGGEEWPIGTQKQITWTSLGSVSNNLHIEYSKDNFTTAINIATGVADTGTYNWTVPDDLSAVAKIRITDASRPAVLDTSDNAFSIVNPIVTITYPNGGELLSVGDVENITWQNTGTVSNSLKIEYSKDSFVSDINVIAANAPNTGSFAWTVPNDVSTTLKIRITDNGRPVVWDKSDANFTILPTPAITITAPVLNDIWRVGTVHNITWTDNGGRISNNLTLQYSTDSGATWNVIATGQPNNGTYAWTIPDNVSATAMVRVFDANRPTTTDDSEIFNLANPSITITSPNGGEVWAVGDPGPVHWTTEGTISENLVLEYSPDAGVTWYLVRGGIPNSGSYSWTIPDYVTSQCLVRLKDGNRPAAVDVSDAVFTINPMPTITFTAPVGGQEFILGQTVAVTWEWTGLAISNLTLDYSNDNFTTRRIIATNLANTGQYSWTIPTDALTGQTIQLRLTDGNRTQITAKSSGYLRIRGGFIILSPNGSEQWVAKSSQTINWQTLGTIPNVKLEYTIDGNNWVFIGSPANAGSYTWTLPDVKSTSVKVRISDPDDSSTTDSSDANFSIVYSTVVFRVLDYDTMQHLQDFSVSEPATGWTDSGLTSPLTRTEQYPYGTYTTFFTKLNYIDNSVTWNPPKQGITPYNITVYLENSANAQVSWEAILTYSFSPANDTLSAVGSLQRKGKLIGTTETERADLGAATLTIYEPNGQTVRNSLVASTPSSTGMYNFTLTDTNFEGGKVYPATLTIEYRAHPYISSANIDVGSEIMQYEFFTQTATQLTQSVSNIERTVSSTAAEIKTEVKDAITSTKNELKADTARILTATEGNIPTKIDQTRAAIDTFQKSEILNIENSVKQGDTLLIRYRTFSGLKPTIDVYNASNTQEIAGVAMTEIGQTGIYEYPVQFSQSWGKGDFSIVCSEASRGSLDALTLTVLSTDIEQVYNQVSSLVGATAGLPNMTNTIANLSTQFAAIESVLSRTSQDLVSGVRNAMGSTTTLGTLYTQIKSVSKQVQAMGGDKGINLEKLYNVSEERQKDMVYLKNKTQELKATMEINKKLIENISNKPIVQTWYEYKQ